MSQSVGVGYLAYQSRFLPDRGLATAAASTVLLFVSWTITGLVYGKLERVKTGISE